MKKTLLVFLTIILILGSLVGCSSDSKTEENVSDEVESSKKEVKELTFMMNFGPEEAVTKAFEEVINDFQNENSGIKIKLIPGNKDYENIMKTKMGANDLPDLWTTHGWSVGRYSEYLMPLTSQAWVKDLKPGIKML